MKKYSIFLVDDDVDDLEHLKEVFQQLQCASEIITFESVEDLLKNTEDNSPDIVVLDHQAPGIKGGDAVKILRQLEQYKDTALFVYSSHMTPEKAEELKAEGAEICLAKGMSISEIRQHAELFCQAAASRRKD